MKYGMRRSLTYPKEARKIIENIIANEIGSFLVKLGRQQTEIHE